MSSPFNACVIGSGPAGIACAHALLGRGLRVLMLDVGLELEADRRRIADSLAQLQPEDWAAAGLETLKGEMAPDRKGIPLKLSWGSDYPYAETSSLIPWHADGVSTRPSLAMGGLSNVWGAAMLPYVQRDLGGWPITTADLAPHYEAVTRLTGLAGDHDDLEAEFPLFHPNPRPVPSSRQSNRLLGNLSRHRHLLRGAGWTFGRSRLAVRSVSTDRQRGCVLCGLCMYGCPYDCIYSAAFTLRALREHPNFVYRPGVVVRRVSETARHVRIEATDRATNERLAIDASRVYIGTGVVPTAQILLRSLELYDQPVLLRDSQYFLVPLLQAGGTPDVAHEALNTLSQVFIEVNNPAVSGNTVHLQLYSYSDVIGAALGATFGPFANVLGGLRRQLEQRMLIVQGYLHSDESSSIEMTLRRASDEVTGDRLHLGARVNPRTAPTVSRVLRHLLRHSRQLGAIAMTPMRQLSEPGRGFHSGGSFPMRDQPGPLETDRFGRPHGFTRTHVVDASVLPSIPATTITFTVMANAHRIGSDSEVG